MTDTPPYLTAGYVLREGFAAMDYARVQTWLAATYWVPGITRERIEQEARNSALLLGAFTSAGLQVGYARVVSDKSRLAYLCDVIVDEPHRGRGLARAMVQFAIDHPEFATIRNWLLATRDAHDVYAPLGFRPLTDPATRPGDWMLRRLAPVPWANSETNNPSLSAGRAPMA